MAANPDHLRRDAEDAARAEIRLFLNRFGRRMYEQAKADISREIADAEPGAVLDGGHIGRAAATRAIGGHLSAEPLDVVEQGALEAPPPEAA